MHALLLPVIMTVPSPRVTDTLLPSMRQGSARSFNENTKIGHILELLANKAPALASTIRLHRLSLSLNSASSVLAPKCSL